MSTFPKLCIHRGADDIGGSCVEIQSANGKRLILDVGMPLNDEKPTPNHMPPVPGLQGGDSSIEGILISHMHADHYGLLHYAHESIPVYMSRFNRNGLAFAANFVDGTKPCPRARIIYANKTFRVGKSFTVTPLPMNHSAYGVFSFLVETDGKRVLYSGDFRGHGRKDSLGDFCKNPPKGISAVLLEGTTLSRNSNGRFRTEHEIEADFENHFRESDGLATVMCSGQNIDRLVTIAKAARKAGKRLVLDFYTAEIIKITGHRGIVPYFEKNTDVYLPWHQKQILIEKQDPKLFARIGSCKPRRIYDLNEIPKYKLSAYVFQLSGSVRKDMDKLKTLKLARPIYSMWEGYWERLDKMIREKKFLKKHGYDEPVFLHTSGHASREDLERYAKAANAKQIIPIHTKVPQLYKSIFPTAKILNNGEWLDIK
ncbi:MBL fold metallo-hydrolase [Ereboglobus sp. PH5-5]|uniref:MBL fold metallo-hydrolase n=1 Tax=Ereboglobus sp. PH5-5 TaxID=2940529 RepID=UPI0024056894|nr:MBL fold metallo-hydrolase [Ereboglobus sp. PH5-5]